MSDLICGKAAVGGNYNSTRDKRIKKMKVGRWEVSKDRPDLSSFLPKI